MVMMKINKFIDHTILKASATREDIKKLCDEAKEYGFYSVLLLSHFLANEAKSGGNALDPVP